MRSHSPPGDATSAGGGLRDAFLSYSRSDLAYVDRLVAHLTAAGLSVWVDRRDILPSAAWMAEVEEGVRRSHCLLFVVSPRSVASAVCQAELDHAVAANKRILPVQCEPVPEAEQPAPLRALHAVAGDDPEEIVRAVRTVPAAARLHTKLYARAWDWDARGRRRGSLLRGAELTEAAGWLANLAEPAPTDLHRAYVAAGRSATRTRRALGVCATVVLLVAATVAAIVGTQAAAAARSRELAARSTAVADLRPDSAMWLARLAMAEFDTPEARSALLTAARTDPRLVRYHPAGDGFAALAADPVRSRMVRSADGSHLAVSRSSGTVDLLAGDATSTLARVPLGWAADAMAFSPDSAVLAVADVGWTTDQRVKLINATTGRITADLPVPLTPGSTNPNDFLPMITPAPMVITSDGLMVVGGMDGVLHGYDLSRKAWTFAAPGHRSRLTALTATPDGSQILSASWGGDVIVHDRSGREVGRLAPFDGTSTIIRSVDALAVDPAGRTVAAGTSEGTVLTWQRPADPANPARWPRTTLNGIQDRDHINEVRFSPDGARLAAASWGDRLFVVDVADDLRIGTPLTAPAFRTTTPIFAADGTSVLWGLRDDGALGEWTVDGPGPLGTLDGPAEDTSTVALAPDGRIAAGSADGTIRLIGNDGRIATVLHHELRDPTNLSPLSAVAFDGATLVSAAGDGSVMRWDLTTGTGQRSDSGQRASAVALSGDGKRVAFAGYDDHIRVLTVGPTPQSVLDVPEGEENVRSLALDGHGDRLGIGDEVGAVSVVDVAAPGARHTLRKHDTYVQALAFAPDATLLASVSDDGALGLNAVPDDGASADPAPSPALTIAIDDDVDRDGLRSVAFSPDGATVAVGSEQNRVLLLDVATRKPVGPPLDAAPAAAECASRPCEPIMGLAYTAGGDLLVASQTGVVRWDLTPDDWPAAVCARAARPSPRDDVTVGGNTCS